MTEQLPTMADMVKQHQRVDIECLAHNCGHAVSLLPDEAVSKFGPSMSFLKLRNLLVCSACGAKGREKQIDVRPNSLDHAYFCQAAHSMRMGGKVDPAPDWMLGQPWLDEFLSSGRL